MILDLKEKYFHIFPAKFACIYGCMFDEDGNIVSLFSGQKSDGKANPGPAPMATNRAMILCQKNT